jgi:hypothetical protein
VEILDTIYLILTIVGILVIGFILGKFLKGKGLLTETSVDYTAQLLLLVKLITVKSLKDEDEKARVLKIFDSVGDVLRYIYLSSDDVLSMEDRKKLAIEQIYLRLADFKIELEPEDNILVELLVTNFMELMPKK